MKKKRAKKKPDRQLPPKLDDSKSNLSYVFTVLGFMAKTFFATVFVSGLFFIISYFFYFPEPEIKIKKGIETSTFADYTIHISNPTKLEIYNFLISIRFDEKYPIIDYDLDEPGFETNLHLKSYQNVKITELTNGRIGGKHFPIRLISGLTASTSRLSSEAVGAISVSVDKTYTGLKGDVFPPLVEPALRSYSYFLEYRHRPFGLLAPISIKKKKWHAFDGKPSVADNYKKYQQKIVFPNGKKDTIIFEITPSKEK